MKALGVDIGGLTTKAVILDSGQIIASSVISTGEEAEQSARAAVDVGVTECVLRRVGPASAVVDVDVTGEIVSVAHLVRVVRRDRDLGVHPDLLGIQSGPLKM